MFARCEGKQGCALDAPKILSLKKCDFSRSKTYYQGEEQKERKGTPVDDAKIIDLFWARNEDTIKQTDALYGRKLNALANKILMNREDAEESVSDGWYHGGIRRML